MVALISVVVAMSAGTVGTALDGVFSQVAGVLGGGSSGEPEAEPVAGSPAQPGTAGRGKSGDTKGHGKGAGGGQGHKESD